jgi:hypothetical protein
MFALGLEPFDAVAKYAHHTELGLPEDCLGDYITFLVDSGATDPVQPPLASAGDLVVYSRHGRVLHCGTLKESGRVVSKWGDGCVWEHGFLELPVTYGNQLRFTRPIPRERLPSGFKLFVWQRTNDKSTLPEWSRAEVQALCEHLGLMPPRD